MGKRRPPDILRKSHAHTERKPREKGKHELQEALEETEAEDEDQTDRDDRKPGHG